MLSLLELNLIHYKKYKFYHKDLFIKRNLILIHLMLFHPIILYYLFYNLIHIYTHHL